MLQLNLSPQLDLLLYVFLVLGSQNWAQYFRYCLEVLSGGDQPSLSVLAMLLLIQPSVWLAFIAVRVHC